jgi:CRISPR-associated endonuclease/helicase Cas3
MPQTGDAEAGRGSREVPTGLFFQYWGKAQPSAEGAQYHLLPYHCLDVAAVGQVLLEQHPRLCSTLAGLLQLDERDFVAWQAFFLALHDVGKFASAFQNLRSDVLRHLQGRTDSHVYSVHHDSLGFLFWRDHLSSTARDEDWLHLKLQAASEKDRWAGLLEDWVRTVTGHHGTPPRTADANLRHHATAQDAAAAVGFAREVRRSCWATDLPPVSRTSRQCCGPCPRRLGAWRDWLCCVTG